MEERFAALAAALGERNIAALYAANKETAKTLILSLIRPGSSVGLGNSATLKDMALGEALAARGCPVYDKTRAASPAEAFTLKRQALLTDWYVAGANAVSLAGQIVNIDHSGNRVAAMLFGPVKVLLVAGTNKLTPDLDSAIDRARNQAAPQNARRAGLKTPCTEVGYCVDCRCPQRVCNSLTIIEGQAEPGRMTLLVIDEALGF